MKTTGISERVLLGTQTWEIKRLLESSRLLTDLRFGNQFVVTCISGNTLSLDKGPHWTVWPCWDIPSVLMLPSFRVLLSLPKMPSHAVATCLKVLPSFMARVK